MKKYIIIVALLSGCFGKSTPTQNTSVTEMRQAEDNHRRLVVAVPPPQLSDSQERRNLVRRLELLNDPNRVSYIYLMTHAGQVVAYYTVKGKVSSLNSFLTTPSQMVRTGDCSQYSPGPCTQMVESPDFDGSYGQNPDGVFFFDTQGIYHEWNGWYLISDQPQRLRVEPIMVAGE